ncbi:hypothetical protein O181_053051 [Austropuccinia psidii MF-1]|uniref:Uncharacterized protein n=1 Tax=Austropuccinia psidii MF-1 TaxID=1389203 RepID=A0A9Q3E6S6_9BASI|nr:hypothetical protein [Austropuccinia psidii MF-1]
MLQLPQEGPSGLSMQRQPNLHQMWGSHTPKTARTQLTYHLSRDVYGVLMKIYSSKAPLTNMRTSIDIPVSVNNAPSDKRKSNNLCQLPKPRAGILVTTFSP